MSIAVTLEDELDISRGEMLAAAHQPPVVAANFAAALVWMNEQPLDAGKSYLLKHTSQTVKARITAIRHRVNMQTLDAEPAATLELNSIGVVNVETTRPLFLDPYVANRLTGSFILIDPVSHATVAAGMVREVLSGQQDTATVAAIAIRNPERLRTVETALIEAGVQVVTTREADRDLWQKLLQIGVVVLIEAEGQADFPADISIAHDPAALVFEPLEEPERRHGSACAQQEQPMSLQEKITTARSLVNQQIASASREDICVTSSFQAEDMVVVHLVREAIADVPVIFLDTGYHFAETYEYRDRLAHEWNLNLVNVLPALTVAEQESQFGILNQTRARSLLWHAQGRPAVRLPRTLSLVVYRAASRAGQDPCQPAAGGRLHLAHGQAVAKDQPAGRLVDPRRLAIRRAVSASRCCRFMKRVTPASAVSHVPACPSILMILAQAAGVAASRNVVSTCNRSRRESSCCSC